MRFLVILYIMPNRKTVTKIYIVRRREVITKGKLQSRIKIYRM